MRRPLMMLLAVATAVALTSCSTAAADQALCGHIAEGDFKAADDAFDEAGEELRNELDYPIGVLSNLQDWEGYPASRGGPFLIGGRTQSDYVDSSTEHVEDMWDACGLDAEDGLEEVQAEVADWATDRYVNN